MYGGRVEVITTCFGSSFIASEEKLRKHVVGTTS